MSKRLRLFAKIGPFRFCVYARNLNRADAQSFPERWNALKAILPELESTVTYTLTDLE